MVYLFIVTLIWAFSFGLIKDQLTGLDSNFVAFARLAISFVLFLPFLRIKSINNSLRLRLLLTGAIQYGIMYISYIYAFRYLQAYQVALFTIFTPVYVTLINDLLERRFHTRFLIAALFGIVGTAIIVFKEIHQSDLQTGFILIQISNISFALGQIYYKKIMAKVVETKDVHIFALLFLGAILVTGFAASFTTDWSTFIISYNQILTLFYLGGIASGLGFFLWNIGARKTNAGTLAVFNNLKIPMAIVVALLFFSEQTNLPRLAIGSILIISTLLINEWLVFRRKV